MSEESIGDTMRELANVAVDIAREDHALDLDFSEASLEQVEQVLAGLCDSIPKDPRSRSSGEGPSEEQIVAAAKIWGAYVGEVIRLRWGGEWSTHSDLSSSPVFTLHVMGYEIFPPSKVYKRLTNGEEDNICYYCHVFSKEFEKREREGPV